MDSKHRFQGNPMTEKEMIDTANWLFILSGCAIFATLVAFVITH